MTIRIFIFSSLEGKEQAIEHR